MNLDLVKAYETEIHNKEEAIDPHNELHWYDLTVGWSIGKGLSPHDAHNFALHIRYNTDLG